MKEVYTNYYPKLVKVLPMNDAIFMAQLYASQFLPGDAKETIAARATRADKASCFLDRYIVAGFEVDESNPLFVKLLNVMEESDDIVLQSVAKEIRNKI